MEFFTPIPLPAELANTRGVQGFQTFLRLGGLAEWQIGYKRYKHDRHICSRFVTAGGTEDSLTSPRPTDTDFASLIEAHLQRAIELMQEEL